MAAAWLSVEPALCLDTEPADVLEHPAVEPKSKHESLSETHVHSLKIIVFAVGRCFNFHPIHEVRYGIFHLQSHIDSQKSFIFGISSDLGFSVKSVQHILLLL